MTNSILQFNKDQLLFRLKGIPKWASGIFAACCVERILPVYSHFSNDLEGINERTLYDALDMLWDIFNNANINNEFVTKYINEIDRLLPDIDVIEYSKSYAYIEDVIASVHYSLIYIIDEQFMDIVWVAIRLKELLFRHCCGDYVGIFTRQMLEQTLQHPLIQQELTRQNRDLNELARQFKDCPKNELIRTFRDRAKKEANTYIDYSVETFINYNK